MKFLTTKAQQETFAHQFLKELQISGIDPENDADKCRVKKFLDNIIASAYNVTTARRI